MVNSKNKGSRWEREAAKLLNENFPEAWRRVAMSGAMGTQLEIPIFKADLIGAYDFFPRQLVAECKVGYGGAKSMSLKREWFEHIKKVGEEAYSLPLVILKFDNSRSDVRHVVAMTFETWNEIIMEYEQLVDELKKAMDEIEELGGSIV